MGSGPTWCRATSRHSKPCARGLQQPAPESFAGRPPGVAGGRRARGQRGHRGQRGVARGARVTASAGGHRVRACRPAGVELAGPPGSGGRGSGVSRAGGRGVVACARARMRARRACRPWSGQRARVARRRARVRGCRPLPGRARVRPSVWRRRACHGASVPPVPRCRPPVAGPWRPLERCRNANRPGTPWQGAGPVGRRVRPLAAVAEFLRH